MTAPAGKGLIALLVLAGLGLVTAGVTGIDFDDEPEADNRRLVPGGPANSKTTVDPLAFRRTLDEPFADRATDAYAHVVYAKSPGGVAATARRVLTFRRRIEAAADQANFPAAKLEALVFLESAGRTQAVSPQGIDGAVGLTQILAETGRNLLDMQVDVGRARALRRIIATNQRALAREAREQARIRARARARARGRILIRDARRLLLLNRRIRQRRALVRQSRRLLPRVDERFDPVKSLAATGRYLQLAKLRFGTDELAFVAYHMGVGNLQDVIRAYTGDRTTPVGKQVQRDRLTYSRLFFDSTPLKNARAYRILNSLGDDSATYLWRLRASEEIMRLYRRDRPELRRLTQLQTAKSSAEEVLHPRARTTVFLAPEDITRAVQGGDLVPFRGEPGRRGYAKSAKMGELAPKLKEKASLYSALRPEALAALRYIAAGVRGISRVRQPLLVTSTVRDTQYQRRLVASGNGEATRRYSLHTTGYAFDIRRKYTNRRQRDAFQHMLDRLKALGLIAWVREPAAIHVTVASEARELLPVTGVESG